MSESILKKEEKISLELRALYKKYGYLPYKMSKFEPYDLYSSNKDFLVGDGVITFNDAFGKLLALKPDVTLSIIKNAGGENCKVYYHENVYRISGATKEFKELMLEELEPLGLKPYIHRFTKEMNLIFKFKRKAEAIVYVKEYGIDLLIYKK